MNKTKYKCNYITKFGNSNAYLGFWGRLVGACVSGNQGNYYDQTFSCVGSLGLLAYYVSATLLFPGSVVY